MMRLETIHPMIVHFPVGLICTSFFLYILYFFKRKDPLKAAFRLFLILGTVGAAAAVGTGLLAHSYVAHNETAHEIIKNFHKPLGISTLCLAAFLCIWGAVIKWDFSGLRAYLYLLVFSATFVVLMLTGYFGGTLVYEHGMGVNPKILMPVEHEHHGEEGQEHHEEEGHEHGEHGH